MNDHIKYLEKLVQEGILDGVEVYYSGFSQEQITTLEKFCKEHNLYMSAGTDCHGERKPNIKLGIGLGNMNVSEEVRTLHKIKVLRKKE